MSSERLPAPAERGLFPASELEQSAADRFAAIASVHPARPAIRDGGREWTYAELAAEAGAVARILGERLEGGPRPVAILQPAGAPLFASMFGALAAGHFYAPLDPALGEGRLEAILREIFPALLLTDAGHLPLARRIAPEETTVLRADDARPAAASGAVLPRVAPDALAYVLFTSGSTGAPKGVTQSHRNLLHHTRNLANGLGLGPDDRITLLSSVSFGASVSGLFGSLLTGACVCPFSLRGDGLRGLPDFLRREEITVYHSVPTVFRRLAAESRADLSRVRVVKLGGEAVRASDFESFRRRFSKSCVFHVGMGATEISVIRQWFAGHETAWPGDSPLGHAVDGVEVVLLDEEGRETSPEGEIAVVSRSLSPGYWNDPERTAAAFSPEPGRPGWRRYRTGDRGRLLPDGMLLHLGRRDGRVKIRGHRVEIPEVEAALSSARGVREAAVSARKDSAGDARLVASVVGEPPERLRVGALRRELARSLPDYMIPSSFLFVEALPRTASGKVDREALALPGRGRPLLESEYVAPRDAREEAIAAAFADLLEIDDVGAEDDFFELGGSSLLAVAAISRLSELLEADLGAIDLVQAPTPALLAARVRDGVPPAPGALVPLQRGGRRRPVFFVPGGSGDGADLLVGARLARSVGREFPFLGLRFDGAAGETVEDVAARCVSRIRDAQKLGPYVLVGECVGGILAGEIARQLEAGGERVAMLALLDTPFPNWKRRFLHAIRSVRAPWGDNLFRRLRHHAHVVASLERGGRLPYVREKARVAAAALTPERRAARRPRLRQRASYVGLLLRFRPRRRAGAIRLIESEEGAAAGFDRLWSRAAASVEVVRVPGDHATYIGEHVGRVAAALRTWLDADGAVEPSEAVPSS